MVHEIWLLTFFHILIGWCAKMRGATVIQVQVTTMVILDEFTLVDDGMKGSGIVQCLRLCVRLVVFYACS